MNFDLILTVIDKIMGLFLSLINFGILDMDKIMGEMM